MDPPVPRAGTVGTPLRSSLLRVALLVASLAGVTGMNTFTVHYNLTLPGDSFMWSKLTPDLIHCKNLCFALPSCTAVTAVQVEHGGVLCHVSDRASLASLLQPNFAAVTLISKVLATPPVAEQQVGAPDAKKVQRTPQSLITESHVKATLAADRGSDAHLISWTVKDFTQKGDNYACIVTSVCVRYSQGGSEKEITYVAKCNPCRPYATLEYFTEIIFEKEIGFYQELVPQLNTELINAGQDNLRLASFFFAHKVHNEQVIILRDLREDSFKMFDRKKGMDKAHATLVLKELGRLHAASILLQAKTPENLSVKYKFLKLDFTALIENEDTAMHGMFAAYFDNAAAMAEKIGGYETVVNWLRDFAPKADDAFIEQVKQSPPFDVICHGDCWNNNVLFRYNEEGLPIDVRLLDLQVSSLASPATDLNYFMYTSMNGPERKENLQTFLKTYYDSLCKTLEDGGRAAPFTLGELIQEYHRKNLFGFIMAMMSVPIVVSEAEDVLDLDNLVHVDMEKFIEDQKEKSLRQLDNNPLLRPRLLSIFDEMTEYGVIS